MNRSQQLRTKIFVLSSFKRYAKKTKINAGKKEQHPKGSIACNGTCITSTEKRSLQENRWKKCCLPIQFQIMRRLIFQQLLTSDDWRYFCKWCVVCKMISSEYLTYNTHYTYTLSDMHTAHTSIVWMFVKMFFSRFTRGQFLFCFLCHLCDATHFSLWFNVRLCAHIAVGSIQRFM